MSGADHVRGQLSPAGSINVWSIVFTSLRTRIAAGGVAVALAALGATAASLDKAVALSVEGQQSTTHVFGSTVADALAKEGITVTDRDLVVPALDQPISDGTEILVRFGRKLTVTVDGQTGEYWTTAGTVDEALSALGIRAHDNAALSVSRSAVLGREGLALSVTNPRGVTIAADGATRTESSTAATVGALLSALGVTVGPLDRVNPAPDTALTEGLAIAVARVEQRTWTETQPVAFATTRKDDATLTKGTTKVATAGVAGQQAVTYTETWVDGVLEGTAVTGTQVTKPAVDKVLLVGTKPAPVVTGASGSAPSAGNTSGAGLNLANAAMWDRIAQCESGGRWNINTGNGYYGGLQFNSATWLSVGGGDFAPRADLATREQQITVANRLYAQRGLQPWTCAWAA